MKRILIAGANSYIGECAKDYIMRTPDKYSVDIINTIGWDPKAQDFACYDVVFNVAGIAHIRETAENRHLYFDINRDLAIKIAKTAKEGNVSHFILLSSMAVYGLTVGHITKTTEPKPNTAYGISKLQADEEIKKLEDEKFKFTCLRPPMVYGKGCKGNYQILRKFALNSPVFPDYTNQRSMIYIKNFCEFVKDCIDFERQGLFFPQNAEYVNTSEMVELIAENHGKKIKPIKVFNWAIEAIPSNTVKKVFGNLTYEKVDVVEKYGFKESIKMTEG